MPNTRLAARYAKALLDFSTENGQLETVHNDMQWLQSVMMQSQEFGSVLRSPVIKPEAKKKILEAVTGGNISAVTKSFTELLITKNREANIQEVITAFTEQYKIAKGIHTAVLTTAVPVSDAVKTAIVNKIKQQTGYENVALEEKVNPALIGGFTIVMGDKMIDSSIAYDLKAVANQFRNNDFIYKVR